MEVVEYAKATVQPDALVYSGRSQMNVFPAIPFAQVAIAAGPPGPAVSMRLSIFNGPGLPQLHSISVFTQMILA